MKNRRNFIKESVIAGIGISTFIPDPKIHASSQMNQDLKIGMIGMTLIATAIWMKTKSLVTTTSFTNGPLTRTRKCG